MTYKGPKCARPQGLTLNECFLGKKKKKQKLPAHNFSGNGHADNAHTSPSRWQRTFHIYLLSPSSSWPHQSSSLLPLFCLWGNWNPERATDLTRLHSEDLEELEALAPISGVPPAWLGQWTLHDWGRLQGSLGWQCQTSSGHSLLQTQPHMLWTHTRISINTTFHTCLLTFFFSFSHLYLCCKALEDL